MDLKYVLAFFLYWIYKVVRRIFQIFLEPIIKWIWNMYWLSFCIEFIRVRSKLEERNPPFWRPTDQYESLATIYRSIKLLTLSLRII